MKNIKVIFIVLFLLFKTTNVYPIGSIDTTLTVTDKSVYFKYIPTFDNGSPVTYVKGFVSFLNGFDLRLGATINFGSVASVNGNINLHHGTLQLTNDLYFGNFATINGPGSINLNGHFIQLSNESMIANGDIHIVGSGGFAGNGNILNLQSKLIFDQLPDERPTFTLDNITIMYVDNLRTFSVRTRDFSHPIKMCFINAGLLLYTFPGDTPAPFVVNGSLDVLGSTKILGPSKQITCKYPIIIDQGATLTIGNDVIFDIGPTSSINFQDASGSFVLDNATLEFETSTTIKTGNFIVQGNSIISSPSFGGPFYFGSPSQDPTLIINPGSTLTVADRTTVIYAG